ncbi:MAG: hypothetical protein M1816_003729 [Peltula sp. TS41687]|nr:MAG: hypothetical protein M1816_003729 [Peltula sp. TS41687]
MRPRQMCGSCALPNNQHAESGPSRSAQNLSSARVTPIHQSPGDSERPRLGRDISNRGKAQGNMNSWSLTFSVPSQIAKAKLMGDKFRRSHKDPKDRKKVITFKLYDKEDRLLEGGHIHETEASTQSQRNTGSNSFEAVVEASRHATGQTKDDALMAVVSDENPIVPLPGHKAQAISTKTLQPKD